MGFNEKFYCAFSAIRIFIVNIIDKPGLFKGYCDEDQIDMPHLL
jgi:hypothetical protein